MLLKNPFYTSIKQFCMDKIRSKNEKPRQIQIIIPPLTEWWVYWNTLVRPSIHPSVRLSLNLVYVTSHLSFVGFYSYLVS